MNTLSVLQEIARVGQRKPVEAATALKDASKAIREALKANAAYLLYGDDWFRKLGESGDPNDYEIKQEGYWLLNRFMADQANSSAFNVIERRVYDVVAARPGVTRSHVATLIPMPEGNAEMLIVGGLSGRLKRSDIAFVELVTPVLAPLVTRLIDSDRSRRQRRQLHALADIARVGRTNPGKGTGAGRAGDGGGGGQRLRQRGDQRPGSQRTKAGLSRPQSGPVFRAPGLPIL